MIDFNCVEEFLIILMTLWQPIEITCEKKLILARSIYWLDEIIFDIEVRRYLFEYLDEFRFISNLFNDFFSFVIVRAILAIDFEEFSQSV